MSVPELKKIYLNDVVPALLKDCGFKNVHQVPKIDKIILLGDYAKGIDSGVIEVLIIGNNINKNYLDRIHPKIENEINRKINFLISSTGTSQNGLVVFEA